MFRLVSETDTIRGRAAKTSKPVPTTLHILEITLHRDLELSEPLRLLELLKISDIRDTPSPVPTILK